MATGGTIPSNRTQSVTFYNTTGVIEREKNIYYAPRLSKTSATAGQELRTAWLNAFTVLCPPSSDYTAISISTWSPQDRVLRVKGNIDDFRLVTDEGACLNYFIITRSISKTSGVTTTTQTHYYGFFITGVRQSGGSTIEITCEPDDFTNVFYLHNKHSLTAGNISGDYEPFNEKMKNCYVNRQHYNRVKFVNSVLKNDNMNVFLNIEESFKFRYQYRDMKFPIDLSGSVDNFTKSEMTLIKNTSDFSLLSGNTQAKVLSCCIHYLAIETKSPQVLLPFIYKDANSNIARPLISGELISKNVNRCNPVVYYPFICSPKEFEKFGIESRVLFNQTIKYNGTRYQTGETSATEIGKQIRDIIIRINSGAIADYIYSVYIVKNIPMGDADLTYDITNLSSIKVTHNLLLPSIYSVSNVAIGVLPTEKGLYPACLRRTIDSYTEVDCVVINSQSPFSPVSAPSMTGILSSGYDRVVSAIDIMSMYELPSVSNLKTSYYDAVLEQEPYSFYSLSTYGSYELVFNKNRYYNESGRYLFIHSFMSINGGVKLGFIPSYSIEGTDSTRYFNEGLTFTVSASMAMYSNSYDSYYNQNKAQMKNQFAVTDVKYKAKLVESEMNLGGNMVNGFMKGTSGLGVDPVKSGVGAGMGLLSTVNELQSIAIDWNADRYNIESTQKAKLADVGNMPDSLKQATSELYYDIYTAQLGTYLNHYTIDNLSHDSICKILERIGYEVNLYDNLHTMDRVGWNFIKLNSFDWNPSTNIMVNQENSIRQIFKSGVTLLHDKTYLTSGHNFETILE